MFIDVPYKVRGGCFDLTECPAVRFGEPANADYARRDPLTIKMRNIFGFRSLVIDGWKLT